MKRTLFLSLTLASCLFVHGQSYSLIDQARQHHFQTTTNGVSSYDDVIAIDSVQTSGQTQIYFNYQVTDSTTSHPYYPCDHRIDAMAPMGGEIHFDNTNFNWYFFNSAGDSIRIAPQTALGGSFVFLRLIGGNYIEAMHSARQLENVLGNLDSVRTFTLAGRNSQGQSFPHPLDGKTIKISRNYGLVTALRFRDLPGDTTMLRLGGLSNPDLGRVNIGPRQLYDWQVGDTFQYERVNYYFAGFNDTTYIENVVQSRYISATEDTMRYTIMRRTWRHHIDYNNSTDTVTSFVDNFTETFTYGGYKWDDTLPELPQQIAGLDQQNAVHGHPALPYYAKETMPVLFHDGDYNGRMQKRYFDAWSHWAGGNCISEALTFGLNPIRDYAEGIGLVYNVFDDQPYQYNHDILTWYRKGGESWGVHKDFSHLVNVVSPIEPPRVAVFPNPAREQVWVEIDGALPSHQGVFCLYDLQGRPVIMEKGDFLGRKAVTLAGLLPGIYLYELVLEGMVPVKGKLLVGKP